MTEAKNNNGVNFKVYRSACMEELKTKIAQEMLDAMLKNTSKHKLFMATVSSNKTV